MIVKRNRHFDSLVPEDEDQKYNTYDFLTQRDNYGNQQYQSKNKNSRDLYPSAGNYYDPYQKSLRPEHGRMEEYDAPRPQPMHEVPKYPVYQYSHAPPAYPPQGYAPAPQPGYYEHPAYAVPKYEQEYSPPPHRQFLQNSSRKKLQEAQNNYYAKKRAVQATAYSDRSLGDRSEDLNPRQRKRKDRFEDFIKYTAPRLQYKSIIKIQALIRGAYVRKKVFPQIIQFHAASVRVVDGMIDHYIEDVYIPDLLLELLAKNKVYENFDLYSEESRWLYEVRASIMERVIRDMIKDIVKTWSDNIVNRYLSKRFRQKEPDERDPLAMVVKGIMNDVMKVQVREIASKGIQALSLDYLIQAQFNSLFYKVWIPREVEHTIIDSIEDIAIQDVITGVVDNIIRQEAPRIADEALDAEKSKQEGEILEDAFQEYIDRWILESWIDNMSHIYQDEEGKIHVKEQQEKALRDHARQKSKQVKEEFRELNKELAASKEITSDKMKNAKDRQGFVIDS